MSSQFLDIIEELSPIEVVTDKGPAGPTGPQGPVGPAGWGVPVGGTVGQVLTKLSGTDFDSDWQTGSGVATLGAIGDVTLATIASGELLKWNGAAWINQTLAEAGIAAATHTHAASDIASGTLADARVAQGNVTQHEGALSVTSSQVSDLAGTSFPLSPYDGQPFVRTDLENHRFCYDATRGKWLGELESSTFGNNISVSGQLKDPFGVIPNTTRGSSPAYPITVVGMACRSTNAFTGEMRLREGTSDTAVTITLSSESVKVDLTLNYDYATGAVPMGITENFTAGNPGHSECTVYYRRVAL